MVSSPLAASWAGMRPASELDSVMEFGLSGASQRASSSLAGRGPDRELVADQLPASFRSGSSYFDMSR